jgi:hypothetical protein
MIDLTKKGLPNVVEINGNSYSIYTDFRVWMRFVNETRHLKRGEYIDVRYLFKNEFPQHCDIRQLFDFCYPPCELPRRKRASSEILFDYELDGDYIYSAFISQYGIDLIEIEELHWHKFLALFRGLKDDEVMCKIMAYRGYEKTDDKKDHALEMKDAWRIKYTTPEEQEEMEKFSNLFT